MSIGSSDAAYADLLLRIVWEELLAVVCFSNQVRGLEFASIEQVASVRAQDDTLCPQSYVFVLLLGFCFVSSYARSFFQDGCVAEFLSSGHRISGDIGSDSRHLKPAIDEGFYFLHRHRKFNGTAMRSEITMPSDEQLRKGGSPTPASPRLRVRRVPQQW